MGGVPAKLIRIVFLKTLCNSCWRSSGGIGTNYRLREAQPQLAQTDVNAFLEWSRRA
jgi:hypothetical protein